MIYVYQFFYLSDSQRDVQVMSGEGVVLIQ